MRFTGLWFAGDKLHGGAEAKWEDNSRVPMPPDARSLRMVAKWKAEQLRVTKRAADRR